MVDIKKVTAIIRKPYLYESQTSTVTEYINFNPANNPPSPGEGSNTVYTIDPFSILTQENNRLKVKIPFTRFYRVKYVIAPLQVDKGAPVANSIDASKTHLAMTEELKLRRVTTGSLADGDEIKSGIYRQNGSAFLVFDPNTKSNPQYTVRTCLTAGVVEGIVELYAGDELIFEHTRVMFKRSYLSITNAQFIGDYFDPSPIAAEVAIYGSFYFLLTNYAEFIQDDFVAASSFFFEISEITDL